MRPCLALKGCAWTCTESEKTCTSIANDRRVRKVDLRRDAKIVLPQELCHSAVDRKNGKEMHFNLFFGSVDCLVVPAGALQGKVHPDEKKWQKCTIQTIPIAEQSEKHASKIASKRLRKPQHRAP